MTRGDKLLMAVILLTAILTAGLLYFRSHLPGAAAAHLQAVIKVQGKNAGRIDLKPGGEYSAFTVKGRLGSSTVEVEGGKVRMKDAPCPEKLCVRQGWISRPGESIVCIPGEIIIRIEGQAPVDAVTR